MDDEWRGAMFKYFKVIELRARYWRMYSTPVEGKEIKIKRLALAKVENELQELG